MSALRLLPAGPWPGLLITLTGAALLAACQTAPASGAAVVPGSPSAPPAATAAPSSPTALPAGSAPEILALDAAQAAARAYAPALKMKRSQERAAAAALREAEARYFPSLSHNLSASWLANPPEGISIPSGSLGSAPTGGRYPVPIPSDDIELVPDAESTYFKVGADITWPVFTWGKIDAAVAIARAQTTQAALERERGERELERDLAKAYYGAVLAEESGAILAVMENLFRQIVADKEMSFEQGSINRESVLEAKSRFATIHAQRIKADQALHSARAGLSFLTGLDAAAARLSTALPGERPVPTGMELAEAVRQRWIERDILAAQYAQARKAREIAANTDLFRPDLGLSIKLDITGQRPPFAANWTDSWDWNLIVSLGTQMKLFDGGAQWAKTDQAQERVEQALIGLAMMDQGLPAQAQRLVEQAANAQAAAAEKAAAEAFARERDKNAQAAYDNELATREEQRGARIAWLMSKLELAAARYQAALAWAEIDYLAGPAFAPAPAPAPAPVESDLPVVQPTPATPDSAP